MNLLYLFIQSINKILQSPVISDLAFFTIRICFHCFRFSPLTLNASDPFSPIRQSFELLPSETILEDQ